MRRLWPVTAFFAAVLALVAGTSAQAWDRGPVKDFATIPVLSVHLVTEEYDAGPVIAPRAPLLRTGRRVSLRSSW
jgi:folate-dependent phosphoribosylglycinamide formyltransferase PurN